ncbi:hypothetical protein GW17_00044993 [Ensete ventricosum]|nr:hypothetical protein GW17_00044993 [Ensete ventricosum]
MLSDGRLERAGRTKMHLKCNSTSPNNGVISVNSSGFFTASIVVVGDEILDTMLVRICFRFGTAEDKLSAALCKKLYGIGWQVTRVAVVQNEVRQLIHYNNH